VGQILWAWQHFHTELDSEKYKTENYLQNTPSANKNATYKPERVEEIDITGFEIR
jgi:hypothetical protein